MSTSGPDSLSPEDAVKAAVSLLEEYNNKIGLLRQVYEQAVLNESNHVDVKLTLNATLNMLGLSDELGTFTEEILDKPFYPAQMAELLTHAQENLTRVFESINTLNQPEKQDQYHVEKVLLNVSFALKDLSKDMEHLGPGKGFQDPIDRFISKIELSLVKLSHAIIHYAKHIEAKFDKKLANEIESDHKRFTEAYNHQTGVQRAAQIAGRGAARLLGMFGFKKGHDALDAAVQESAVSSPKERIQAQGEKAQAEASEISRKLKK